MDQKRQIVDISYESIIRVIVVFLGLFLLFYIRDIIFILFSSIVLALIVTPAVDKLEEKKIPRTIGAAILFLSAFALLGLVTYFVAPPLAGEIKQLALKIPHIDSRFFSINHRFGSEFSGPLQNVLIEISGYLKEMTSSVFAGIFSLLGGVISSLLMIIISFYLAIEENGIEKFVKAIAPHNLQTRILKTIEKIQVKLGRWFIGQLSLGFIVGTMSFAGLYVLGVPYALLLAMIAGILELIPYIGPTISAIPAIIIAFTVSPNLAALTLLLYFLVQQLENYLIVPKVMEKTINLHPIITIIAIVIGGKLAGILGAMLAVPTAMIISIILKDIHSHNSNTGKT